MNSPKQKVTIPPYDIIIVGGGVTGTAILYTLATYTTVPRIALIESYANAGTVNSHSHNNSQTLHFGDIESHYDLTKATHVKQKADLVRGYVERYATDRLHEKFHKLLLAVGHDEIATIDARLDTFKDLFPELKKLSREELSSLEPNVMHGRKHDVPVSALFSPNGYTIDYQKLSQSFVRRAQEVTNKHIDVWYETPIERIEKTDSGYTLHSKNTIFSTSVLNISCGPQSLTFAYELGYGGDLILLPVAGNFFSSPQKLHGKVYMMQNPKLPFASVHGDPDVQNPYITRYGPTARVIPMLERHVYKSVAEFFRLFRFRIHAILALLKIIADPVYLRYVAKQVLSDIPVLGRWAYLQEVRKIVPSLTFSELTRLKGFGGIRPQVVNIKKKTMSFGEAKIVGDNIIFNITPSPGASTCLGNAQEDVRTMITCVQGTHTFDEATFLSDLTPKE
jgi:malate dehydrogenase (quinone)